MNGPLMLVIFFSLAIIIVESSFHRERKRTIGLFSVPKLDTVPGLPNNNLECILTK